MYTQLPSLFPEPLAGLPLFIQRNSVCLHSRIIMWPEIEKAIKEKRHELKLLPDNVNKELSVDESLFLCEELNLLTISDTKLIEVPAKIETLKNLQNLLLFRNKITQFPGSVHQLSKLKVLDLSYNCIQCVPEEINELAQLTTLNLSYNEISEFPVVKLHKLSVLNLSGNQLKDIPEFLNETYNVSDLILAENAIESIPDYLQNISTTLKVLNLEKNAIKELPKLLSTLPKIKDILLKGNPIADKRLLKLINQCGTKQIVDYVKQHGVVAGKGGSGKSKGSGKGGKSSSASVEDASPKEEKEVEVPVVPPQITVAKYDDERSLQVTCTEVVRQLRPHIVCCLWKDVAFDSASFKTFIQLQTKLHESVCQKRELCTIATHDYDKIVRAEDRNITYTAAAGDKIPIVPLGRKNTLTAQKYYEELRSEAEALRKEKKRNTYSGIHKFLHLLDKSENFAYLRDHSGTTISLPPLTNSDNTACSVDTKNILIEITSSSSLPGCKTAFDALISEIVAKRIGQCGEDSRSISLEQVKVVDEEGNLRSVYPSKVDLQLKGVTINRE